MKFIFYDEDNDVDDDDDGHDDDDVFIDITKTLRKDRCKKRELREPQSFLLFFSNSTFKTRLFRKTAREILRCFFYLKIKMQT